MNKSVSASREGMFIAGLLWRNVLPVANPTGVVLHFSDCYEPRTGGIETQVANLAHAQRQAGMKVQVVTATEGHRINDLHRISVPLPFDLPVHPRTRARVAELVNRLKPTVAHVHIGVTSPFAWGALRALGEVNIPTVVTVHSMWGSIARAGYRAAFSSKPWRRSDPRIIWSAVSEQAAVRVRQSLRIPVYQMPNGIDLAAWSFPNTHAGPPRFISVLRMAPRKRVIPLLKIIEEIQQEAADTSAIVIGDGPLLPRAKAFAKKRALNVDFRGRLQSAQIKAELAASDVFIQPSVQESFGIAALEARAAGMVVLARRGTGTESFITNGVNGFIANSDAHMASLAIQLVKNPGQIESIKHFNRENPPEFDWGSVVSISQRLYESAQGR
jgi:phosphatidylinositol alpha 1,6-mannosyltransferase